MYLPHREKKDYLFFGGRGVLLAREMENLSRVTAFGDFVTILTEGSMQDNTVARLQSTRVHTTDSPLPLH
jgi:hypothetical protein